MIITRKFVSSTIVGISVIAYSFIGLVQKSLSAPAPPLTALKVVGVYSDKGGVNGKGGWEQPITSIFSTQYPHYGNTLEVNVCETGYGQFPIAKFNTVPMTLVSSTPTLNGSLVTGFCRTWLYKDSFNGGIFTYQATSINYPFRTLSIRFSIISR